MEPLFCPYCGEKNLEELEPTEIMVDNDLWIIYHYECQDCAEVFDKIVLRDEDLMGGIPEDTDENEDGFWS
ncbi:MAG: hypothetical protein FXF49_06025 [Flexistipes sinusarabici]|uniref:Uncharacterized protein n=1 Tax=Flexistipes sinusarabici TaxID=2352 RepID=A0A5D0MNF3_FLESI|nr:hypothetical protein [Flexistipes sinusarabici]TYB33465.1 MAG: hypothetical protein FXF49_06025 [Flexistipes sinusarabici]